MIFYLTLIFSLVFDLISKYFAKIYLVNQTNILSDFLFLKYTQNSGIAFSIQIPFLKIVTLVLIFAIFFYYFKEEAKKYDKILDLAFGLILGGAIGNGIERIFVGVVTDFIGVKYFSVFNLADSFIFIGVILYIFKIFFKK